MCHNINNVTEKIHPNPKLISGDNRIHRIILTTMFYYEVSNTTRIESL